MIGCWAALASGAAPGVSLPDGDVAERNPVAILPADAPSTVDGQGDAPRRSENAGSENVLVVLLTNENGLVPADEKVYGTLVDRLRRTTSTS